MSRFLGAAASRSPRIGGNVALISLVALSTMACRGGPDPVSVHGTPVAVSPPAPTSADAPPPTPDPAPPPLGAAITAPAGSPELAAEVRAVLDGAGRDTWFGVYMQDRKVGHFRLLYRASRGDEPGALAMVQDLDMTVDAGGRQARMTLSERRFYDDAPGFAMVATDMELRASGMTDLRRATRSPDGLVVTRTVNGEAQAARTVPSSRDSLGFIAASSPPAPGKLSVGAVQTIYNWDWQGESDEEVRVTVIEVDERRIAGITSHVGVLSLDYRTTGITMTTEVADGGSVLRMSLGPALTLRQEDEDVAKSNIVGLDAANAGVPLDAKLGDPGAVSRLVLTARLPPGYDLPSDPRQRVTVGEAGGARITLVRGAGAQVTDAERAAGLAEDPTVDWRSAPIVALAERVTSGLSTPRDKAHALSRWVFENLSKRLATHLPTASAVLERKEGDCTEHAWLFTALARAAGIPARPVYGLAWGGDLDGRFAYHAWSEVELDGAWWAVDPTWGEPIADATHLALGTDLKRVGAVVGGLSLELVEVQTAP